MGSVASPEHWGEGSIRGPAQWVRGPVSLQRQCGLKPKLKSDPQELYMLWGTEKGKKKKKERERALRAGVIAPLGCTLSQTHLGLPGPSGV